MITITDLAKEKIQGMMESQGHDDLALRVAIQGRGPAGFMYQLQFVKVDTNSKEDEVIDAGSFPVFIDAKTAPDLNGSTLDFVDEISQRGFNIENPNPLWHDPLSLSVQNVIDQQINPAIAGHGGFVSLLEVKEGKAYVALGGGCQGCGMADVTLKGGIEVMLTEAIPEITQVIDTTDHAAGDNPYYQPAKGGQSPGQSPLGRN
jgi:Fe/S biogenesis protein NfuA